jgi:hypothetical protein
LETLAVEGAIMRIRLYAIVIAAALPAPHAVVAQSLNPPYLSQMPSVARVKADIKGSDPIDTSARQMGAFWQRHQLRMFEPELGICEVRTSALRARRWDFRINRHDQQRGNRQAGSADPACPLTRTSRQVTS